MHHIQCDHFMDGGPTPAVYYADSLRAAFREVCKSLAGKTRVTRSELAPLWNLVEQMATARMFYVSRALYDAVDSRIEIMGRSTLVRLALRHFLRPSVEEYLSLLDSGRVNPRDAVICYMRLSATYDWLVDNMAASTVVDPVTSSLLREFGKIVGRHYEILQRLSDEVPDVRVFWRMVLSKVNPHFSCPEYRALAG